MLTACGTSHSCPATSSGSMPLLHPIAMRPQLQLSCRFNRAPPGRIAGGGCPALCSWLHPSACLTNTRCLHQCCPAATAAPAAAAAAAAAFDACTAAVAAACPVPAAAAAAMPASHAGQAQLQVLRSRVGCRCKGSLQRQCCTRQHSPLMCCLCCVLHLLEGCCGGC